MNQVTFGVLIHEPLPIVLIVAWQFCWMGNLKSEPYLSSNLVYAQFSHNFFVHFNAQARSIWDGNETALNFRQFFDQAMNEWVRFNVELLRVTAHWGAGSKV